MPAKCIIHGGSFSESGRCSKCFSCTHPSFWMDEVDFKLNRYRCTNCHKMFKSVPDGKETHVLWKGKWLNLKDVDKKPEEEIIKVVEEANEIHLSVCTQCGKEYEPKRSDSKYCSNSCRLKSHRNKS